MRDKLLVYGEDLYRARKFIEQVTDQNFKLITPEDRLDRQIEQIDQPSLFGKTAVFVLRHLLDQLTEERAARLFSTPRPHIVWETTAKLPNGKIVKKYRQQAKVKEFKPLSSSQTKQWLKRRLKEMELDLDYRIVVELVKMHGANLYLLEGELKKLKLYTRALHHDGTGRARQKKITIGDLAKLSTRTVEQRVFDLLDAVGQKDLEGVQKSLRLLLDQRVDPWYLYYLLVKQIRNLYQLRLGMKLSLHPYVLKKLNRQKRKWTEEELFAALKSLRSLEYRVKTGESEIEAEVVNLIFQEAARGAI